MKILNRDSLLGYVRNKNIFKVNYINCFFRYGIGFFLKHRLLLIVRIV